MRKPAAGFTLLEMLLALAIFALLGLMANRMLQQSLALERTAASHSQRLAQIQHAFYLFERDLFALLPRSVRGNGPFSGRSLQAEEGNKGDDSLVFTRGGWPNPGDQLRRSRLQRTGYRLEKGELIRNYLDHPEVPEGVQPHRQVILAEVASLQLRYWSQGRWARQWQSVETLPQAIEVTLTLNEGETLVRRFLLPEAG